VLALIFDVDGTLVETEELHRAAFNEAFAAEGGLGWHWDQALYARLLAVTGGKERIAEYQRSLGLAALPAAEVAALHAAKTGHYTRLVAEGGLQLRPGVRRLLEAAHQAGVRRAIATTTSPANVEALLAACGQLPAFDVVAAGDEVAAKKPAADVYLLALRRLGVPAEACVAVEDTENGLLSARGAGLRCLITTSLYGGRGPFSGAAAVVSDLGEPGTPAELLAGPTLAGGLVDLGWLAALPAASA
jgi:HAD superfamily hydrolase (TIGR01509 family)